MQPTNRVLVVPHPMDDGSERACAIKLLLCCLARAMKPVRLFFEMPDQSAVTSFGLVQHGTAFGSARLFTCYVVSRWAMMCIPHIIYDCFESRLWRTAQY